MSAQRQAQEKVAGQAGEQCRHVAQAAAGAGARRRVRSGAGAARGAQAQAGMRAGAQSEQQEAHRYLLQVERSLLLRHAALCFLSLLQRALFHDADTLHFFFLLTPIRFRRFLLITPFLSIYSSHCGRALTSTTCHSITPASIRQEAGGSMGKGMAWQVSRGRQVGTAGSGR